ncbi:MAG TPA: hypothetical protein DD620_04515 [Verrucomicrobia bacterium]|nr:hypothetical protein [Kiritimatiellaceae bacterium]HBO87989.1 hypothetical protein [Verrucomicrobiota bacterium]|tara:strand:+ start:536 stop:1093 length:558 start_codon:yes stop_codon:yes gene_type:complete
MRDQREQWSVSKCAVRCSQCDKPFEDRETVTSILTFVDGNFERIDYGSCTKDLNNILESNAPHAVSIWKTTFYTPSVEEKSIPKENVESLLRERMRAERPEDRDIIFILAVMLERKRLLIERGVQLLADGFKIRVYEHRKTQESFTVTDPGLRLDELEQVQDEVTILLGGQLRSRPATETDVSGG